MQILATVLYWAIQAFIYAMFGRFVVDLVLSINRGWRPKGLVLVLVEIVMTITDPPLKFVRRFLPPVRLGAIALDFGWTLVLIAAVMAQRAVLLLA